MMHDETEVYKSNLQTEYKFAFLICIITPVIAFIFLPFIRGYAGYFINLRLPDHINYLESLFSYTNILMVAILSILPLIWLGSIKLELRYGKGLHGKKPYAVGISVLIILIASIAFKTEKVQWFYLEAGKARFERFSFLRSLVFWKREQMDFVQKEEKHQLMLLGSSQVNLGIDGELLAARNPELQARVKALPGFSILQYQMLTAYVLKQKPDSVVCWISEYDMFYEQQIPANRLRYFATFDQTLQLSKLIGLKRLWLNRGEMADISFACVMSFWKDRDMLRELLINRLWTPVDISPGTRQGNEAEHEAFWQHVNTLKENIQRTDFVEVNFDSFKLFAQALVENGIMLYVFEGIIHPEAMSAYDPGSAFRCETRNRLRSMADRMGFCYVDESQLPAFNTNDFADVFHLNDKACKRFTCFLSDYLMNNISIAKGNGWTENWRP